MGWSERETERKCRQQAQTAVLRSSAMKAERTKASRGHGAKRSFLRMGKQGCVSLSPGAMQQGRDSAGEEERVRAGRPPTGGGWGLRGVLASEWVTQMGSKEGVDHRP